MKITEYMKNAAVKKPGELCLDTSELLSLSVAGGFFPSCAPMPRELNAATHAHADILNGTRLEFAAMAKGYSRALWISSPDAAFLGLVPKNSPVPLVSRNAGGVNACLAYLLDSFSAESFCRMCSLAGPKTGREFQNSPRGNASPAVLRARSRLAEKVFYAAANYDAGIIGRAGRSRAAECYRLNTGRGSSALAAARSIRESCIKNIAPPSISAFEYLRKYHTQQITALNLLPQGIHKDAGLKSSLGFLSGNPAESVKVVFFSRLFASRLCRPGLSASPDQGAAPAASRVSHARKETPVEEFILR
jgi:hypothetical protein